MTPIQKPNCNCLDDLQLAETAAKTRQEGKPEEHVNLGNFKEGFLEGLLVARRQLRERVCKRLGFRDLIR